MQRTQHAVPHSSIMMLTLEWSSHNLRLLGSSPSLSHPTP